LFELIKPQALKIFAGYLFGLFIFLLIIDWALQFSIQHSDLMTGPTEINSPATLYAKVDALRNSKGVRIAVLGDSIVYGRSLQEHGIEAWRKNNLTAALSNELLTNLPNRRIEVMNFGMNGITPSELEVILPWVMSAKPDVILIDLTLRSFSRDFNDPEVSPRAWLKTMAIDPQSGSLSLSGNAFAYESSISAFMIQNYFLYRVREIFQFRLFEASTKDFLVDMRNKINSFFRGIPDVPRFPDRLMLQLKAQQRYAQVDLEEDNVQWNAYQRLLVGIKNAKQKTLIFYATENPVVRDSLIEEVSYQSMINKIEQVTQTGGQALFIGPVADLDPENFLDHVHLTPSGYQVLAKRLAVEVLKFLN
jgi:lysophospholipase L1-like esterase